MRERERVEATCILVLILIEQLTTCYIWLTLYVKKEITNSARCNMNKRNNENRPLHFMKKTRIIFTHNIQLVVMFK